MRVVLDTSVVVSGFRSQDGAANAILQCVFAGKLQLLASPPLFLEYEAVLLRPEHMAVHGFSVEQIEIFLTESAVLVIPVRIHFQWKPQLTDPSDELVLETAINGQTDAIVTHNVKHFSAASIRFGFDVLRPHEALRRIRS
jgi:putative PIN family toxin of toxin-antitoxin system